MVRFVLLLLAAAVLVAPSALASHGSYQPSQSLFLQMFDLDTPMYVTHRQPVVFPGRIDQDSLQPTRLGNATGRHLYGAVLLDALTSDPRFTKVAQDPTQGRIEGDWRFSPPGMTAWLYVRALELPEGAGWWPNLLNTTFRVRLLTTSAYEEEGPALASGMATVDVGRLKQGRSFNDVLDVPIHLIATVTTVPAGTRLAVAIDWWDGDGDPGQSLRVASQRFSFIADGDHPNRIEFAGPAGVEAKQLLANTDSRGVSFYGTASSVWGTGEIDWSRASIMVTEIGTANTTMLSASEAKGPYANFRWDRAVANATQSFYVEWRVVDREGHAAFLSRYGRLQDGHFLLSETYPFEAPKESAGAAGATVLFVLAAAAWNSRRRRTGWASRQERTGRS